MGTYYKVARANGYDWHTGNTIDYRANVGNTVQCTTNPQGLDPVVCTPTVIHACSTPAGALHFIEDSLGVTLEDCSFYRVSGEYVAWMHTSDIYGFDEFIVEEELTQEEFEALLES